MFTTLKSVVYVDGALLGQMFLVLSMTIFPIATYVLSCFPACCYLCHAGECSDLYTLGLGNLLGVLFVCSVSLRVCALSVPVCAFCPSPCVCSVRLSVCVLCPSLCALSVAPCVRSVRLCVLCPSVCTHLCVPCVMFKYSLLLSTSKVPGNNWCLKFSIVVKQKITNEEIDLLSLL